MTTREMLIPIPLKQFGVFVALSRDKTLYFAMMTDNEEPYTKADNTINWFRVSKNGGIWPKPLFIETVNVIYGTKFCTEDFDD